MIAPPRPTVDLNADVGESWGRWSLGDDLAVLDLVTSANVACGFHAGDPTTLRHTVAAAAVRGVAVGAQVSYPDLRGFGRRFVEVPHEDLLNDVLYQLGALEALCRVEGTRVRYLKPHGALYNAVVEHEEQAAAVADAVRLWDPTLPVVGLPGSALLRLATDRGLRTVPEAFADRAYAADGTLVPRERPGAVLHDPAVVADRVVRLVTSGVVASVDGELVTVDARSVCVHGDTPGAVHLARAVREGLTEAGISVASFVS